MFCSINQNGIIQTWDPMQGKCVNTLKCKMVRFLF